MWAGFAEGWYQRRIWNGVKNYVGQQGRENTQRDCVEWCGTEQEMGKLEQCFCDLFSKVKVGCVVIYPLFIVVV